MRAELYRKHLYYKLYRALQDEGYSEEQMSFEKDVCYVLPIGFFSFRFVSGKPFIVHFLVFKDHRSLGNAMALYRMARNVFASMGFASFVTMIKDGLFFEKFIKWIARDSGIEPYMILGDEKIYHITCRR